MQGLGLVENNFDNSTINENNQKDEISLGEVKVFPNPFSKKLFISFQTSITQEYKINVYNMLGEKIHEEEVVAPKGFSQIEIQELVNKPSGIYLIEITSEDGYILTTKQVVKKLTHL